MMQRPNDSPALFQSPKTRIPWRAGLAKRGNHMNHRQKRIVLANYGVALMMVFLAAVMIFKGYWVGEKSSISRNIWILAGLLTGMAGGIVGIFSIHISAIWRNLYWLASLASREGGHPKNTEIQSTHENKWPWGSHHTEMLGHLEAAGKRFWVRYDPADPSTAPTNEFVSRWLREERGVSREKANAIASILRADGLRSGPR